VVPQHANFSPLHSVLLSARIANPIPEFTIGGMKPLPHDKTLWTPDEFADHVGCSRELVYYLCRAGKIGRKFGSKGRSPWILEVADFAKFATRTTMPKLRNQKNL
jgi:hypothetical protein